MVFFVFLFYVSFYVFCARTFLLLLPKWWNLCRSLVFVPTQGLLWKVHPASFSWLGKLVTELSSSIQPKVPLYCSSPVCFGLWFFDSLSRFKSLDFKDVWHARLGNPQFKLLSLLHNRKLVDVNGWLKKPTSINCQLGKNCKLPFSLHPSIRTLPFKKVHFDEIHFYPPITSM